MAVLHPNARGEHLRTPVGFYYKTMDSNCILGGAGESTAANRVSNATASKNFFGYWFTTSASGVRGMYMRLYQTSTGSTDVMRLYGTCTATTGVTGHQGLHVTASMSGATSAVSGLQVGARVAVDLADSTAPAGSHYALMVETLSATNSQGTSMTEYAPILIRTTANGTAGAGTKPNYLMVIGDTEGQVNSTMFASASRTTIDNKLKIKVNGTDYWICLTNAV